MNRTTALISLCLLAPVLSRADTLDVYANLLGKTVLMPSVLPVVPESVVPDPLTDKTNAIATIERALGEKEIEVVQDGPHFVRLVPGRAREFMTNAPLRGAELAPGNGQERLPAGMIDFSGADVNQVLDIYGMMRQRTILRPGILNAPTVRLRTQGGLTLEEGIYALTTVLALSGIAVVDDGANFVQVVPMQQRKEVKTRAPKPEPGAKLFDPSKVPTAGVVVSASPRNEMERLEQEFERVKKALYDFVHFPDPAKRPAAQRLFELYARVTDKTTVASPKFYGTGIWFRVGTPLTRNELLYAIETTFELNNLAIIPVDDRRIRLGHISEVRRSDGGKPGGEKRGEN
jgi:hypothetical protein